jgi:hypothetical protein
VDQRRVSGEDFDRLEMGMTCEHAGTILGAPGDELARCRFDGVPGVMEPIETVVYAWVNSDGSSIHATFQNGRLISKSRSRIPQDSAQE